MKELPTRILSALFFLLIVVGGIFGGSTTFLLLFGLIGALCLKEFTTLFEGISPQQTSLSARGLIVLLALWPYVIVAVWLLQSNSEEPMKYSWLLPRFAAFWGGLILLLVLGVLKYPKHPMHLFATALSGAFYIALPLGLFALATFNQGTYRPLLALALLTLSWANDTGAYFIGSRWGKHKLMPTVSPGKSWEGLLGGLVLTLLLAFLLNSWVPLPNSSNPGWLIPALLASTLGPLGDLLESALKRSTRVKDSGQILPGHGGALDRFDAFLFHIPFSAAWILCSS